jgi:PAS domain S-box-containing protein
LNEINCIKEFSQTYFGMKTELIDVASTAGQAIDFIGNVPSESTFQLMIESVPSAMILGNHESKIVFVNSHAEKLFGYDRTELIGRSIEVIIPERHREKRPGFQSLFFNSPGAGASVARGELFALRKDGTEFPMELGLNPLASPGSGLVLAVIVDATERKHAEERFRLVVESAPNAIVLVNQEGKIKLVNSATEKLFGYSSEELTGKTLEMLAPGRFKEIHPQFRDKFNAAPKMRSMGAGRDLFAMRKDGSEFPVEIGLSPLDSVEGNLVMASIIDITDRKIQAAHRLKSDFLANMSHELRTPLNAVLGFSELMIDKKVGDLNAKQLEYLNDIHASGSHLLRLINNVLDLSKIEAGKTDLRPESFDVVEVIEGVTKVLRPIADKKHVQIEQSLSTEVGIVRIDKNKFRQILYNLLSNAIKFSQDNSMVRIETAQRGSTEFILKVSDSGIGISQENLKKLFIPFVQLDSGLARQHEGSGLGLALTRNIVILHRGEIQVESTLGTGSTFSVVLPLIYRKQQPVIT